MAWEATRLVDCIAISKKFERGVIFSTTPESAFALLGPVLDGMRIQSKSYVNQAESLERISVPQSATESASTALAPNASMLDASSGRPLGSDTTGDPAGNMDKSDEKDPNFGEKLAGNWGLTNEDGNFDMTNAFDSKCIPCGLKLDQAGMEAFFTDLGTGVVDGLSYYLKFWEELLKKQLNQLQDMLSLFDNTDSYMDLCAFTKFFTEFMCVPDIPRILSTLMALMKKQSFEFSGILDLLIQLVGPLFSPFLSNLIAIVESFLKMIIKPIECIIDAIQALLVKFDYNILFTNIKSLDKHIDLGGPKESAWLPTEDNSTKNRNPDPRGDYVFRLDEPRLSEDEPKVPWLDGHIARRDIADGERYLEGDFNMAGPVSTWTDAENASNQQAVADASENLRSVHAAGRSVDGSDPQAISRQREKEQEAEDEYRAAIDKRDFSVIGRANKNIETAQQGLKSGLMMLIGFLREGAQAVQGFFDFIFDEFKKLMAEYVGGSGNIINEIIKKLALSNMINTISSIYESLQKNAFCEEDSGEVEVGDILPNIAGMTVWTDDEGNVHIQGDEDEINTAMDAVLEAQGVDADPLSPAVRDRGGQPDTAGQKLKSLIEFTGDPVLDASIARATEQLTTPVNVVFKCPLNTTVEQTEQINQWIQEVNT